MHLLLNVNGIYHENLNVILKARDLFGLISGPSIDVVEESLSKFDFIAQDTPLDIGCKIIHVFGPYYFVRLTRHLEEASWP